MDRTPWVPVASGRRGSGPALSKGELAVVGLALLLPIPLVALSRVSVPLPGLVQRGIASLVPSVAVTSAPASLSTRPVRAASPAQLPGVTPARALGGTLAGSAKLAAVAGSARSPGTPAGGSRGPVAVGDRAGSRPVSGTRATAPARSQAGGESQPPTTGGPGESAPITVSAGPGGVAASIDLSPAPVQAQASASVSTGLSDGGHPPAAAATVTGGVAGSAPISASVDTGAVPTEPPAVGVPGLP